MSSNDSNDQALEHIETPLNACSLETDCIDQNAPSIPLCLGCYQLNESTGKREGRLDLYDVPNTVQSFGAPPLTVFGNDGEPGVLDGKWSNRPTTSDKFRNYYATAHANGEIWVHDIFRNDNGQLEASLAGKSESPSENEGLCLALAWESSLYSEMDSNEKLDSRIISSYSDGYAAIHRIQRIDNGLTIELEHHWEAHNMFGCPAEVWCANFVDSNTVVTGGDEGSWKIWDLRQDLMRPIHHAKHDFGAGVTVLAPHPKIPNLLAVGSYDETVAIYDLRKSVDNTSMNRKPDLLYHSESLGGGIWRLKWHPFERNKLLVAAMHGGCVVGEFDSLESADNWEFRIQREFKLHKSMAYGIDWLATGSGAEAAASCSFYDKAMYLWNTGSK